MALIKCLECGVDVSDKAEVCPNCGCPISVSVHEIEIKKKELKERQKKNLKKHFCGVLVLILVTLGIVIGLRYLFTKANRDGYYGKTRWGMSVKEVQDILGEEAIFNESKDTLIETIEDYEGMKNVDALHTYAFDKGELYEVTLFLLFEENDTDSANEIIDKYQKQFDSLYGEHDKESVKCIWKAKKSEVSIINFSKQMVVIKYCDITKVED